MALAEARVGLKGEELFTSSTNFNLGGRMPWSLVVSKARASAMTTSGSEKLAINRRASSCLVLEAAASIPGLDMSAAGPFSVLSNDEDLPLSMVVEGDIDLGELLLLVVLVPSD
jgi:hypothetical protein